MRIDRYLNPPTAAEGGPANPPGVARVAPWLALGFRPFFLAAALMAALWVPLWLFVYLAKLALPLGDATAWHAHELVFGFAGAVLAGFLLTAARNWTKRPTPSGRRLGLLLSLWLAGRVVMLFGGALPSLVVLIVDVAFLPAVAIALAVPLLAAKNRRNYAFVPMLLVLAGIDVVFHLGSYAVVRAAMHASVGMIVLFLVVMGGRVIPFFTRSACPGVVVTTHAWLDWTCAVTTAAYGVAQLVDLATTTHVLALVAGGANLARVVGWNTRATLGNPLLWVLHLGYLWIGLGLVLIGLSAWVPALGGSAPTHALTVGALGTLVIGMMARVSLGHTGRPLVAPPSMRIAFLLVTLATLLRVVPPLVSVELVPASLVASGVAFSLAFALFVVAYAPLLTRPRVDGAPG